MSRGSIIQSQCTCKVTPIAAAEASSSTLSPVAVRRCVCFPNVVFRLGLIEISTVDRGVISLFGVRSELFVAMNSRGRLYGTVRLCARAHTHKHTHPAQCKMSSCSCCIRGFMSTVVLLICSDDRGFHSGVHGVPPENTCSVSEIFPSCTQVKVP